MKNKYATNTDRYMLFLIFILIYVSEDVLLFTTALGRIFFWIKIVVLVLLTVHMYARIFFTHSKLEKNSVLIGIVLILCCVVTTGIQGDIDARESYTVLLIILALTIVNVIPIERFIDGYCKVISFLAFCSLVEYIVFLVAYPITLLAPQVVNVANVQFSCWVFTNSLNREYYQIMPYRNWGIYREPGVYACFLLLAIFLEFFAKEQVNTKRLGLLLITMFTTFSTTGYIVSAVAVFILICKTDFTKKRNLRLLLGGLVILAVAGTAIAASFGDQIYNWVFRKLTYSTGSSASRFGSILTNLFLFLRSPIWGNGWIKTARDSSTIQNIIVSLHNTNTMLIFFAVYGFIYGVLMCGGSYLFFKKATKSSNLIIVLGITLCWFMALSGENITLNIIVYLIAFYGIKSERRIQRHRKAVRQ